MRRCIASAASPGTIDVNARLGATFSLALSIFTAALYTFLTGAAGADASTDSIKAGYASMDAGWRHHVAEEEIAPLGPVVRVTDASGATHVLDRSKQLEAARFDVREEPGNQYFPRQVTIVKSLTTDSDLAHVLGTTIKELVFVDKYGTSADVRFTIRIEDEWSRILGTWRLVATHVLSLEKYADGSPSPALLAQLKSMHATVGALKGFQRGQQRVILHDRRAETEIRRRDSQGVLFSVNREKDRGTARRPSRDYVRSGSVR